MRPTFDRLLFVLFTVSSLSFLASSCARLPRTLDLQGHRGARGLYPENSLEAFAYAYSLPEVTTLELDVVISADGRVVISHEPWLNPEICALDSAIVAENPTAYNLFRMTVDSIQQFTCGATGHPRFTDQKAMATVKPTLFELFELLDSLSTAHGTPWPNLNIETKSRPEGDQKFHPGPKVFMGILANEIRLAYRFFPEAHLQERITIQSFDPRTLKALRNEFLGVKSCLLVEGKADPEAEMDAMGFAVDTYSPAWELVTPELVQWCHFRRISIIPWTVNEVDDMQRLVDMGVDGLISDYPDRFAQLVY